MSGKIPDAITDVLRLYVAFGVRDRSRWISLLHSRGFMPFDKGSQAMIMVSVTSIGRSADPS